MSPETAQRQKVPVGTYVADKVHSSLGFAITHNGVSTFRSGFQSYEAKLSGGAEPRLEGTVDVTSIEVEEEQLKGHLLSPDFFDAERHPQLRFSSTELSVGEDGGARLLGEVEIKGAKREVEASGKFGQIGASLDGNPRLGLSLETTLDRRDFGLDWNAELPSGGQILDYAVTINVELEFVAEAE